MEWLDERRNRLANSWTPVVNNKKSHSKDVILLVMRAKDSKKKKNMDGFKSYIRFYKEAIWCFSRSLYLIFKRLQICVPQTWTKTFQTLKKTKSTCSVCARVHQYSLYFLNWWIYIIFPLLTSLKHIFTNSIRVCYSSSSLSSAAMKS